jgi:hypothetical protein
MVRVEGHLTVVFHVFEPRSQTRAHDVVRSNQVDRSFVVSEGAGLRIGNVDQLAGILGGIEDRNPRTVKKVGSWRFCRPCRFRKLEASRPGNRCVLHVSCDGDSMREQFFPLESPHQLVRQRNLEPMFSSVRIVTFAINCRLVSQIRCARSNKRPCRLFIDRMVSVERRTSDF